VSILPAWNFSFIAIYTFSIEQAMVKLSIHFPLSKPWLKLSIYFPLRRLC